MTTAFVLSGGANLVAAQVGMLQAVDPTTRLARATHRHGTS